MSRLTNPYQDQNGLPQIRKSIAAFLDILGFSKGAENASKAGAQQQHLEKLKNALTEAKRPFLVDEKAYEQFDDSKVAPYVVKVFTDNIVLGIPIHDDGESELGKMISLAGNYQYTLLRHGFFVRGGITIGDLYMDEDTVYGTGLLDAYTAEISLARDPRIVLDAKAMGLVHQHLTYYANVSAAPHNEDLLVDSDTQMFVNYLMVPLDGELPSASYLTTLSQHRDLVKARLLEFLDRPQLWSKYAWTGTYHNVICTDFLGQPKYAIEEHLLRRPATRLSKVYKKAKDSIWIGERKIATWKSVLQIKNEQTSNPR